MAGGVFVSINVIQPGDRAAELVRGLATAMPEVPIDTGASERVPVILRDAKTEEQAKATLEDELDGLEGAEDWRDYLRVRTSVD